MGKQLASYCCFGANNCITHIISNAMFHFMNTYDVCAIMAAAFTFDLELH